MHFQGVILFSKVQICISKLLIFLSKVIQLDPSGTERFDFITKQRTNIASLIEKENYISQLQMEAAELKDEHRKEMIELSNYIDEMREREEKKDVEMEELR